MNNLALFNEAIKYHGVKEIPGKQHNSIIVGWSQRILSWVNDDEISWCSSFLNAMAENVGLEHSGKANARSWLDVGTPIENPVIGDVVIYWRVSPTDWRGHVGIFVGYSYDGKSILTLGGNQSNQVNISPYSVDRLLGFRRLKQIV